MKSLILIGISFFASSFVVEKNGIIDDIIYNAESEEFIKDGEVFCSDKLMEYFVLWTKGKKFW